MAIRERGADSGHLPEGANPRSAQVDSDVPWIAPRSASTEAVNALEWGMCTSTPRGPRCNNQ
jgi:hypothetical protein